MRVDLDASEVQGLARHLAAAQARIATSSRSVVADTASDIERDAERLAPVLTGLLVRSIRSDPNGLTATVGSNVRYAVYQEYGTSKMAPQPFLNPATDLHVAPFLRAVADAAEDALD